MSWRDLVGVVAPEVLDHARTTSERLRELGVPHAVCGGVAVGVLGYPRTTKDVDFLIGREGEDPAHPHGLSADVAALYQKDLVDFVLVRRREPEQGLLLDFLKRQDADPGRIPVVGPLELVWLKLSTPAHRRRHDIDDLIQLLRVGALDANEILAWLEVCDRHKAEDFAEVVQEAMAGGH
jgi:hypothetical protein